MAATIRKIELPGSRLDGQLADAFGAAPRPEDETVFERGMQNVERAERDADLAGALIRIH